MKLEHWPVKIWVRCDKSFLADSHIVSSAHGKLVQIAEQMKMLQKQAEDVLKKAKEDQMLAHAACNFEKKPGQIYHLYKWVFRISLKRISKM